MQRYLCIWLLHELDTNKTTASGLWALVEKTALLKTRDFTISSIAISRNLGAAALSLCPPISPRTHLRNNRTSLLTGYGCPAFLPCATLCAGLPDEDWNRRALTRVHVQVWGSRIKSRGIGWSPNCSLSSWESLLTHTMVAHTSNLSLYQ
jgi:hypothetical protein